MTDDLGEREPFVPEPVGKVLWTSENDYTCDELYFVADASAGAIKIGRAANSRARVSGMQTGNPRPLELLISFPNQGWQEDFWHCAWQLDHIRGEWFTATQELRAAIEALRKGEDWTDHVPPLILFDGEAPDIGEWREHLLDAFDAYQEVALFGDPSLNARQAAELAIFDRDFDGRCVATRHYEAVKAAEARGDPAYCDAS